MEQVARPRRVRSSPASEIERGNTHAHTKKRAMSCACERALAHMHMRTEQDLSIRGARVQIVRARARVRAFAQHSSPFRPYASPPARSPVDERKSKSVFPMNNLTAQTAASGGRMMSAIRSNTPRTTNKHRHTQKKTVPTSAAVWACGCLPQFKIFRMHFRARPSTPHPTPQERPRTVTGIPDVTRRVSRALNNDIQHVIHNTYNTLSHGCFLFLPSFASQYITFRTRTRANTHTHVQSAAHTHTRNMYSSSGGPVSLSGVI